jgi:hypothetical protein
VTSRRPPLGPIERGDVDAEGLGKLASVVDRDRDGAGLDSVDLEIASADKIGELLTAQFLAAADARDPHGHHGRFLRHTNHLSETDRKRNTLSAHGTQDRDTVSAMQPARAPSVEDIEDWMQYLRLVTDKGKPDWSRVAVGMAGLGETQGYIVKSRWGTNPEQMAKVIAALEQYEAEQRAPTPSGARLSAIAEWYELGLEIARMPDVMEREIARVRSVARDVRRAVDGERARRALLSPTPEPHKPRK